MTKITRFADIPQFTRDANYRANIPWNHVQETLSRYINNHNLDMNPDFQREHVWTEEQQIRYIEFRLRGGKSGSDILFNHPNWLSSGRGADMVLVDGKQRLEALRRFLDNEIPAFGSFFSEFEDKNFLVGVDFIFAVNNLKTRQEVLQWYVDLNAGGTPHTNDEINKVKALIEGEIKPSPKLAP